MPWFFFYIYIYFSSFDLFSLKERRGEGGERRNSVDPRGGRKKGAWAKEIMLVVWCGDVM